MTDLGTEVERLKKQIADAQQRKVRAETQAAVAADRVRQVEKALREEFGIAPAQAAARIAELEDDLAAEAVRIRVALEKAEASE